MVGTMATAVFLGTQKWVLFNFKKRIIYISIEYSLKGKNEVTV